MKIFSQADNQIFPFFFSFPSKRLKDSPDFLSFFSSFWRYLFLLFSLEFFSYIFFYDWSNEKLHSSAQLFRTHKSPATERNGPNRCVSDLNLSFVFSDDNRKSATRVRFFSKWLLDIFLLFFFCLRVFHQPPSAPSLRGRSNINDPLLTDWGLCIALKKWEKSPWRHRLPCQRFQEGRKKRKKEKKKIRKIFRSTNLYIVGKTRRPPPLFFFFFLKNCLIFHRGPEAHHSEHRWCE